MVRRILMLWIFACIVWSNAFGAAPAPVAQSDTLLSMERFAPRHIILPCALIAIGAIGVENEWLRHINRDIVRHVGSDHSYRFTDAAQFVGAGAYLAIGELGVESVHSLRDRALVRITSGIMLEALVQPVKRIVHSPRPDGSDMRSFPSGHTARAFVDAELIRMEYGTWWGVGAYAFASGVAVLRVCGRHHWPTDVLGGAGFGILAARMGCWLLPFEKRLLGLNHDKKSAAMLAVLPAYSPYGRTLSLGVSIGF